MTRRYVIVGNGIAGQSAAEELRRLDADCHIVMIAAEPHPLYNRVALPRYLRGQMRREKVFMRTLDDYARLGIELHLSTWATEVDVRRRRIETNRGHQLAYDALLLATGGRPKPPPWPGSQEIANVRAFQTIDDTDRVIDQSDGARKVLVMGGSFIAYELAEGIAFRKRAEVTWIMRGPWFLRSVLDADGGRLCHLLGEEAGVEFVLEDEVARFNSQNGAFRAETSRGRRLGDFDLLAYGVGLDYYVEPARNTGVEIKRGIVTDAALRTSAPDVYAAGDVAVFHDRMLNRHNQMGTWDNAEAHGVTAAHNMAGANEDFFDVPTYTTTMFGSTLAVMGITPDIQPGLEAVHTVSFEERYFRKLFFLEGRLVGAIMIGPPKGRKKLIEIMRRQEPIEGPRQALLDPANLR